MFELADAGVQAALDAGATYADARAMTTRSRGVVARDGMMESLDDDEVAGVGVRVLSGAAWGFAATSRLEATEAASAGRRAAAIARASAALPGRDLRLAEVPAVTDHWETAVTDDPFSGGARAPDLLVAVTGTMAAEPAVAVARGQLRFTVRDQWFSSSAGHRISQRFTHSGGGISATAADEHETQVRSYPQSFGQFAGGGWEVVEAFDLAAHAPRVAAEAAALLTAPRCPEGVTDVILGSAQMALQLHESVGHAIELDRILGWEAAFAGTSFLDLDRLGELRYGSELMNVTADATIPGALGSFGYDDEGTPAQCVDIVRDGRWVGVLSGRDSAHIAGVPPGGMVRGDGHNRLPMVRMTNVGLLPGESSLEEMIAATDDGILMDVNRSWSIDDQRRNFQFGCEVGWEIKDGRRGRMLRNPTYTGITPRFWASMDMLAGPDEHTTWGVPNCGKGQPMQVMATGHHAAPARFRDVRVGVQATP